MVTQEEAKVKLSMDTTVVGTAKRQLADFAETGHAGFLKASTGGREFSKVIGDISRESGVAGIALRALISPIGAAMVGATTLFAWANSKLAQFNAELDKIEERNKLPSGLSQKDIDAIQTKRAAEDVRHREFLLSLNELRGQEIRILERQLSLTNQLAGLESKRIGLRKEASMAMLNVGVATGLILPQDAAEKAHQIQKKAAQDQWNNEQSRLKAEKDAIGGKISELEGKAIATKWKFDSAFKSRRKAEDQLEAAGAAVKGEEAFQVPKNDDNVFQPGWHIRMAKKIADSFKGTAYLNRPELGNAFEWVNDRLNKKGQRLDEEQAKAEQAHTDRLRKNVQAQKDATAALEERKIAEEKAKKQLEDFNNELKTLKDKSEAAESALKAHDQTSPAAVQSPIPQGLFSMGELAQYNTPYGAVARTIMARNQFARFAMAAGRPDIYQRAMGSIWGADGQRGLMDLLPKNFTAEQNEVERQRRMAADLIAEINKSKGLAVVIKGIETPD